MPERARPDKVFNMMVGMIRSRYVKCLARDGSTRREARSRNEASATNRERGGFACTAGGRILSSIHTSFSSNLERDSVVCRAPGSQLVRQLSVTTLR